MLIRFISCLLFMLLAGSSFAQIRLTEESIQQGLRHAHVSKEYFGGGVAVVDIDQDGYEDLYMTGGHFQDELFLNKQGRYFERISKSSGVFDQTRMFTTMAVAYGDINNDGYPDIFLTTHRNMSCRLLINNRDQTFTDISASAGIIHESWSMGAVFIDANQDGLLDIYVVNYIENGRVLFDENNQVNGFDHDCGRNYLYINQGDQTFEEMADAYGVADAGCGLAVISIDINQDGYPDLLVANDFGQWVIPNAAFINQYPEQGFVNQAVALGLDTDIYAMGIAHGDYDNDGDLDLYITNLGENKLLRNDGGVFTDISGNTGTESEWVEGSYSTGWGAIFWDADNDGTVELHVANGYVPSAQFIASAAHDPDRLYTFSGSDSFTEDANYTGYGGASRGTVTGDFNLNGKLDLVVSVNKRVVQDSENMRFYRNETTHVGNFISLHLEGTVSNRDAYGSTVEVYFGNTRRIAALAPGGTFASQSSKRIHVAAADFQKADSIVVTWPNAQKETFYNLEVNEHYLLREDSGLVLLMGCMRSFDPNYHPQAKVNFGCSSPVLQVRDKVTREFLIYPNPARGSLQLKYPKSVTEAVDIRVFNSSGAQLLHFDQFKDETLDISSLNTGMYIMHITSDSHRSVLPFIVGE